MRNFFLFLLMISAGFSQAQTTRFIYHVTMKPDSTDRQVVKTETAYLDVSPSGSVFYSENRLKRDSLMIKMRQTGGAGFDRSQFANLRSDLDFTVQKDLKTLKTTLTARIGLDSYSYEEDRPFDWKILPETTMIGAYKAQKAETEFAGRTWQAWFAPELPYQDGPYKFSGLPGLIVKVEDTKGDYSFDLKETKKIGNPAELFQRGTVLKVKRQVFNEQQKKFKTDPLAAFQGGGRGPRITLQANPAQRREIEKRVQADLVKNNNPIELN